MSTFYRSILAFTAILITTFSSAETVLQVYCEQCRGTEYPRDYGNFALNQFYGPGSWILEDEIIVINPQQDWAHVDLSFVLVDNIFFDLADLIGLNLGIPNGDIRMDILTQTGSTFSYDIDLDAIDAMGPLAVGADDHNNQGGGGSGSGSGSSGTGDNGDGSGSNDTGTGGGGNGSGGSGTGGDGSGGAGSGGGGVGSGGGSGSGGAGSGGSGGAGSGGGSACTSAGGDDWHCVAF